VSYYYAGAQLHEISVPDGVPQALLCNTSHIILLVMLRSIGFIALLLAVAACEYDDGAPNFPVNNVEGYSPIYVSAEAALADITVQPPRALSNPGKIYIIGKYLLINDQLHGVHIYDNTNPAHPVSKGFLNILGNTDVAIRGSVLYANNLTDLIAVNFTDPGNIQELSRFPQDYWSLELPPVVDTYFECIDNSKGMVLGWQKQTLASPKCYR